MSAVIKVENLGKKYIIGHKRQGGYVALRDVIVDKIKNFGKKDDFVEKEEFWALKDVSFEIKQGDRVGIIGRNGAGKSTLLKLLSRITEPSTGRISIKGRVASLLEVGTGFHPELTGRENIYLNGAILGMTKAEIKKKFDEIVAFAEVEKFLDTPVKRYSSGMYVRLAFAVAAHLEPEILVVDEVLAVGDLKFQKKCMEKMEQVGNEGRTVLFVSHNKGAIINLCERAILLSEGKVICDDKTEIAMKEYEKKAVYYKIDERTAINDQRVRRGAGQLRISGLKICDKNGIEQNKFCMGDEINFQISCKFYEKVEGCAIYIAMKSNITNEILTTLRHIVTLKTCYPEQSIYFNVKIPMLTLRPGEYPIYIQLSEAAIETSKFDVLDGIVTPLSINLGAEYLYQNFEPTNLKGYFSMESHLECL